MQACRLELEHLNLAAWLQGPEDGVPLIALHGWLDNAASFERLAPYLPGVRLLALDLAGHGLSDHRPPGVSYHLWDYAFDVLCVADHLGWRRFSLLGHSMGASIAVLLAGSAPERIVRLGLIDGLLPPTCEPEAAPSRLGQAMRRLARRSPRKTPRYATFEQARQARMQASLPVSGEAAERLLARGLRAVEGGHVWRSDPRLLLPSPMRLSAAHAEAFLAALRCPVRLVVAEQGVYRETGAREALYCQVGDVRPLPGGHHLHLDDEAGAVAVAAAFADFFVPGGEGKIMSQSIP